MARTNKAGLDYFPLDVDFFQDDKIQFVSARFGIKGELVSIRLLCKIYRNGYFTDWNDDAALLFAKSVGDGCQDSFVKDVVHELLKRGFFDESIFERFGILTSKGIQNRYFEITERRKSVDVFREYLLVDVSKIKNVYINRINVYINSINDDICTQRKGKERKVNTEELSKANSLSDGKPPDDPELFDYKRFVDWFNTYTKGIFGLAKYPIGDKRKASIRARVREYGRQTFHEAFVKATNSNFLKGNNQRGFTATMDWIIKPSNFEKIISGNYDNKENENNRRNRPEASDIEAATELGAALAAAAKNGQ